MLAIMMSCSSDTIDSLDKRTVLNGSTRLEPRLKESVELFHGADVSVVLVKHASRQLPVGVDAQFLVASVALAEPQHVMRAGLGSLVVGFRPSEVEVLQVKGFLEEFLEALHGAVGVLQRLHHQMCDAVGPPVESLDEGLVLHPFEDFGGVGEIDVEVPFPVVFFEVGQDPVNEVNCLFGVVESLRVHGHRDDVEVAQKQRAHAQDDIVCSGHVDLHVQVLCDLGEAKVGRALLLGVDQQR